MAIPTSVASAAAVEVSGVGRVFQAKGGPVTALRDIDLRIEPGELFGVLGPNGAGKSTLIKILSTLLLPTSGSASIFGLDVVTETERVRRIMNIVAGGDFSGYGLLTVREQLAMFAQFYGMPYREGMRRVDSQLDAFGIAEIADRKISALSTGQRQKLNFARSFLNDPWILFLDEPTLGLDPASRQAVWGYIRDLRRRAGTAPNFDYSPELQASGIVWTETTLDKWLRNPGAMVPGTRMDFQMPNDEQREYVLEYMRNADLPGYIKAIQGLK